MSEDRESGETYSSWSSYDECDLMEDAIARYEKDPKKANPMIEAILARREIAKYQTDLDRCIKTYKNTLHNNIDFKCISIFKQYTSLYNNYAKIHRIPREKIQFYQDIRSIYNNCCDFSDKEFMLDPSSFIR